MGHTTSSSPPLRLHMMVQICLNLCSLDRMHMYSNNGGSEHGNINELIPHSTFPLVFAITTLTEEGLQSPLTWFLTEFHHFPQIELGATLRHVPPSLSSYYDFIQTLVISLWILYLLSTPFSQESRLWPGCVPLAASTILNTHCS